MRILVQHKQQLDRLIDALQTSLGRLLTQEDSEDIKTAIFLHCAMIVFYKDFRWALTNNTFSDRSFVACLNEKFPYLFDERVCTDLFSCLETQYQFTLPSHVASQELLCLLEYVAVLMSEAQCLLNTINDKKKNFETWGGGLVVGSGLAMLVCKFIETVSISALPWLLPLFTGIAMLLLVGGVIALYQSASARCKSWETDRSFFPLWQNHDVNYLDREMRRKRSYIYSGADFKIPATPKVLIENDCEKNIARIVPSLFFKLDKSLTITQEDLEPSVELTRV